MTQKRAFSRLSLVMVAIILAGGVAVALSSDLSGPTWNRSTIGTTYPSTQGYGVSAGVAFGPSGSSVPQTTVLGGGGGSTETVTGTVTQVSTSTTETQAQSADGSLSTGQPGLPAGTNSSGHSIEFTGTISLQVSDPAASLQQAGQVAYGLGGYVGGTYYDASSNGSATVTLMVPAKNFQAAITQLQALGEVLDLQSSSNDVTVQYSDLNATLVSLVTEQGSLLKLLNQSNDINSTIQIESIIQQTGAQINSVKSQILQTAQLVDYASIAVDLTAPQKTAVPAPMALKLSATPKEGLSPLSVTFDAIVSGGTGPYVVNYNFGDGTSAQGNQLIHQFTQAGVFNVTVSATDTLGNVSLASVIVTVKSPPVQSGLSNFAASVWGLFSSVVEGIVEVAVVVLPIGLVAYLAAAPAWRRYSKSRESRTPEERQAR